MVESKNPSAIRSQKEITNSLIALMHKYPYNEITVKQIILESKLAKKTFYRNFESKDDVLLSLIMATLRTYFSVVDSGNADVLNTIFNFAANNKELLMILDKNDMMFVVLRCMNAYLSMHKTGNVSTTNPFLDLFSGLDSEYLIALNIGAIWNVISLWVHRGMKDDASYVKNTVQEYIERL